MVVRFMFKVQDEASGIAKPHLGHAGTFRRQ